jgi:hypothetical protein
MLSYTQQIKKVTKLITEIENETEDLALDIKVKDIREHDIQAKLDEIAQQAHDNDLRLKVLRKLLAVMLASEKGFSYSFWELENYINSKEFVEIGDDDIDHLEERIWNKREENWNKMVAESRGKMHV